MILAGTRARRIEKQDAPRLWNVVEEMTIASGLIAMDLTVRVFCVYNRHSF